MTARPFTQFNFEVQLRLEGESDPICQGAFSEVDGLEMTMEPLTIREGGGNGRQIHLAGPVSYGQLTLKRGMSDSLDLWDWFDRLQTERDLRAEGEIRMMSADRKTTNVTYVLRGCLPVMLKGAAMNAADGSVAVEEMQVAFETLHRKKAGG
ncbi:MAG: phage tail protein [Pseudomonadota bacterium]